MSATTFVRMPNAKQMAMMGIPDLPEAAFGGDIPPMQRKALVRAMGIRPQGGGGGGLKSVIGVVAAIAIPFAAPAIVGAIASSTAIAASMPFVTAALSTTAGAVVGSAIVGAGLGAVTAKVTGQDVGRSALMGFVGGGIGGYMNAGSITAQGANVGTGSTSLTSAGTPVATTPTANAVVTNVGSNTGIYSPELGQFIDPMTGNTVAAQNIAYGGTIDSSLAARLGSGSASAQEVANAIQASGTLSVNTPAAMGGNAAALGSTNYYQPVTGAYSPQFNTATGAAIDQSPAYAQAGMKVTPAIEQAAANASVQSGQMTNVPGKGGAPTTTVSSTSGATGGPASVAAPATLSEALKQKLTNPSSQADFVLRAAGQIVGSQIAGDGLSDEEKALVAQQKAELESLRTTNKALFDQKVQQALEFAGESRYFDPETFGLRASRQVQNAGARAKQEGLRGIDTRRAGLRRAEERRYNLGIDTGAQTAFLQGMDTAEQNKLRVKQAGLSAIPGVGPEASNMQYASYLGNMYDTADRRRRQAAGDVGELFGGFTGGAKSSGTTIKIG